MKSRTFITLAVASTFGWSAGAYAGSSHEVQTPFSVSENGPNIVSPHHGFGSEHMSTAAAPDIVAQDTGYLELSDATDWSASFDQMAEADSGGYLVSWTPVALDGWDYYVIDIVDSSDQLAIGDETYVVAPTDYIALFPSDDLTLSQEDQVAIVLSESPVLDTAEVG
ncbi:MAG: hypothetical protein JWO70_2065 [Betaproteobacteria bacterium]|nr:hypothetical protein [Betaproteobacteria bacterium]